MATFFQIPGNIKQRFIPFVVDPKDEKASWKPANTSVDLKGSHPQIFSFRDDTKSGGRPIGLLNICPDSYKQYLADDLSFQSIYPLTYANGKTTTDKFTYKELFNNIPGIQIREFLPDTMLDQLINMFLSMMRVMSSLMQKDEDKTKSETGQSPKPKEDEEGKQNQFFESLKKCTSWAIKYMTGNVDPNLMDALKPKLEGSAAKFYSSMDADMRTYLLTMPFNIYYRFQSCVTTNIYELPCILDGQMVASDGHKGWGDGGAIELVNQNIGNIPVLGKIVKTLFGNIRINFMPTWDSTKGFSTEDPDVTVKFDLFNDTAEHAMWNYIFVNTLIPNNRWVQYNVFQHSSSLYDIKLEGIQRLYACSGNFKVSQKGILRTPSVGWLNLIRKHMNPQVDAALVDALVSQRIAKIPDVYSVEMTFKSLLPANFNTYIFTFSGNNDQMVDYTSKAYDDNIIIDGLNTGIKDFAEKLKSYWPDSFPE